MAHILTASWYNTATSNYVTVNDEKVDVPYALKNGDIIKIYSDNGDSSAIWINGENIGSSFYGSINLSDIDINYAESDWGPVFEPSIPVITINYTEQTVARKSVDLTTLPGWSSLSSGSHNITIVAKADGYRDSEPSAAVSVTKAPQEYTDCITFTGESSDFTLAVGSDGAKEWDGTVQYSTDHNTWTTWNGTAVSSVNKKLYLRGSGNTKFFTDKGAKLSLSARAACSGNIQTLLEYSNPPTSIPANYCYSRMFRNCTNLTQAPALPATTLTNSCYYFMFADCTSLTQAPELPATTLATSCYNGMFSGCTSLTQAPELPATTLESDCYNNMFYGCTSLTQAPELPATTLASMCYFFMFYGCTSLKISATRSSEYPTAWRIPSSGTISSTATNWNFYMLYDTGGTFTSDPIINTTYYGAWQSSAPTLISFTIAGTSYQAEEGMTWEQWVNSSYNTGGFYIISSTIYQSDNYFIPSANPSDVISNEYAYTIASGGSSGGDN